jgi:arabinosyltransferase C
VALGFILLVGLGVYGLWAGREYFNELSPRGKGGLAWFVVLFGAMAAAAGSHSSGYWLTTGFWAGSMIAFLAVVWLLASESDGRNMLLSWGVIGLIAPYFPALFQRKLMMGLSVPWAILAGIGLAAILAGRERGVRNLVAIFGLAVLSGTSLQWFFREIALIRSDVSSTTLHAPYLSPNAAEIMAKLAELGPGRRTVLAMPGIAMPGPTPGTFGAPYLPDLNPVASGLTGAYSYAGHWSETPDYMRRRDDATLFFLRRTPEEQADFLREKQIDFLIAPVPEAFPEIAQMNQGRALPDVRGLGEVLVDGPQFRLIHVRVTSP